MGIFSTRETASIIYISLFVFFAILHKTFRTSILNLIKCTLKIKLLVPFILILLYACIIICVLNKVTLLDYIYIKKIIIWVLFSGIPVCFNAMNNTIEEHYFKHMITNNIKFAALAEFLTGTFTFSLLIELIMQPLITFFILLQAISTIEEKYKALSKILNYIITILGFVILGFTIITAINEYMQVDSMQAIISFCLPLVLSILYLPFAYFFAVYSKYDILFTRMTLMEPQEKKLKMINRLKVLSICKLSYKKICKFSKEYVKNMYVTTSENEFDIIVSNFRNSNR